MREIYITKQQLSSPSKFKDTLELRELVASLKKEFRINFSEEELILLVLSACRCNEFEIVKEIERKGYLIDV